LKRRLTFAIIGTVVVTLVLAGLMTLAFAFEARVRPSATCAGR
jgi:hypothetical protein